MRSDTVFLNPSFGFLRKRFILAPLPKILPLCFPKFISFVQQ
jgi:hypothetical protein